MKFFFFFSAQRSRDSTDSKNSTFFGTIPNSLSENLARQIEWYSIYTLSKVCLFTTLMLLELQGSRRAVDISWLISKVGWIFGRFVWFGDCWHHVSWRECLCSTQFMWWPESIWSNAAWSGGVCLHESHLTMHHGFSIWHWMVCDLVRRRAKLMVCGRSNELFFRGKGVFQDDKWQMTSSLWLQPNRLIITAVVAKILIWIFYKHDLIDLKLFRKLYM